MNLHIQITLNGFVNAYDIKIGKGIAVLINVYGVVNRNLAENLLFAPEKGEDLRAQIKTLLKKYGVCKCTKEEDLEMLVDEIAEEIKK